jgi:ATP-dependent RNA helicase DeaD
VERIARRHLRDPQEISIKSRTATAATIHQRYWTVDNFHKLDALTRILEVEPFDALLMFVRTKTATTLLAERLEARGYSAAALNGDMAQKDRERTIERLKNGSLDILVATDVAARGLDVERISHVVNYDIPYDTEAYIHRIGRTGRAGRKGEAILFVAPRERRMLAAIEHATRQKIEPLQLPTTEMVNNRRIANFKQRITDTLAAGELKFMQGLLEQYRMEHDVPALDIAAALARMHLGDQPLLLEPDKPGQRVHEEKPHSRQQEKSGKKREHQAATMPDEGMERFRIEVGHRHRVKPGNIVGAITNEAGLDGKFIGHIDIHPEYSLVDLPKDMPEDVFQDLRKMRVCGQMLNLSRVGASGAAAAGKRTPVGKRPFKDKRKADGKKSPKGKGFKKKGK